MLTVAGVQLLGPDKRWPVSRVISLLSAGVRPLSSSPLLCPEWPQLPGARVPECGTTGQWRQVCGDSSNLLCTPLATTRLHTATVCIHTTSSASSHYLPPRTPSLRWPDHNAGPGHSSQVRIQLKMFYTIYTYCFLRFYTINNVHCTQYSQ